PDAPRRAVTAAREMLAAIEQHNVRSDWPLRIGIGVHLGQVVAGNVGSPRRTEYTVIGDPVHLASRIDALNKRVGSQPLISGRGPQGDRLESRRGGARRCADPGLRAAGSRVAFGLTAIYAAAGKLDRRLHLARLTHRHL